MVVVVVVAAVVVVVVVVVAVIVVVVVVVVMEVKGCTNPAPQLTRATKFCTAALTIWDLSLKLSLRQSSIEF
jgi:hypothetical protein